MQIQDVQTRIQPFADMLSAAIQAEEECLAANVDENDYTVFTSQDLSFELELVIQNIAKKFSFVDNQVRNSQLYYVIIRFIHSLYRC